MHMAISYNEWIHGEQQLHIIDINLLHAARKKLKATQNIKAIVNILYIKLRANFLSSYNRTHVRFLFGWTRVPHFSKLYFLVMTFFTLCILRRFFRFFTN